MAQHTLSVLVENSPGVLARVASLFSRRGYNIDSLAVGPTESPEISRITIVLNLEGHALDQVSAQLFKLVNVIGIQEMEDKNSHQRELLMVKVNSAGDNRSKIEAVLIGAIRDQRANGLICLSGDTHYGEISRLDVNVPYPLWDITSSGLTEVWPVTPPNALRVGDVYREQNFGLLTIDWNGESPRVLAEVRDVHGTVRLQQPILIADLTV